MTLVGALKDVNKDLRLQLHMVCSVHDILCPCSHLCACLVCVQLYIYSTVCGVVWMFICFCHSGTNRSQRADTEGRYVQYV